LELENPRRLSRETPLLAAREAGTRLPIHPQAVISPTVRGKTSRSTGPPRLKVGAISPSLQSATSMPTQTQKRVRRRLPARRRVHSTEPPEPPLSNPEDGSEHLALGSGRRSGSLSSGGTVPTAGPEDNVSRQTRNSPPAENQLHYNSPSS
jgi:hypothetical protein